MPIVKDKNVICHIGLADFAVESVNDVPFYRRYSEFCKLFARMVPSVDFEKCFAQPQENNTKKIIEWYYVPGNESPMKLSEVQAVDADLYQSFVQQRQGIIDGIRAALVKANENEQKYLSAVLVNLEEDYIDSITYCYDDHVLIGIWGMRTKTGRQIDSVIKEGVLDHRAYRITYQIEGKGRMKPFSAINRRYGHILHGERDIPQIIPEEGYFFKEWVPEAPHGKEVKSDLVYTAVCAKIEVDGIPGGSGDSQPENQCQVRFSTGEHGDPMGQAWYQKNKGDVLRAEEVPSVNPHEGFKFVGWDKNPDGYVVNEDVEFVAQYEEVGKEEEHRYQVRFDKGEHGELKGRTLYEKRKDEIVLESEVPEVVPDEGYRFVRWDKEPKNHVVTEDVVFVALYEEVKKSWWERFWGWGSGCLNWLLTLLLLGLIGLLLWYLLAGFRNFNFCGCDCEEYEEIVIPETKTYFDPQEYVPLEEDPCGRVTESKYNQGVIKPVNMGRTMGVFQFDYNTYTAKDEITIYNGKTPTGQPIFHYKGGTMLDGTDSSGNVTKMVRFNSNDGYITVVVKPVDSGTRWDFTVNCPEN